MPHKRSEKKEKDPLALGFAESQTSRNISLPSSTNTSNICPLNIDSEDTLSNAESIPTSPDPIPDDAGNGQSSSNVLQTNVVQLDTAIRDSRSVSHTIIEGKNMDDTLNSASFIWQANVDINHTITGNNVQTESQLINVNFNYVEASASQSSCHISKGNQNSAQAYVSNDNFGSFQEPHWPRHYEQPSGTALGIANNSIMIGNTETNRGEQKPDAGNIQSTRSGNYTDNSVWDYLQTEVADALWNLNQKPAEPDTTITKTSRRPLRQNTRSSANSHKNTRSQIGKNNFQFNQGSTNRPRTAMPPSFYQAPADGNAINGSALTVLELEKLYCKFTQHGHFRHDPQNPNIILYGSPTYQNFMRGHPGPSRDANFATNNGNMQNSPANHANWNFNNVSQPMDSVNQSSSNGNSMNQWGQSADCSSVNNVTKNASPMMNDQNLRTDKTHNMMNYRFPVPPQWYDSMYNPYLNTGNPYYSNIYNPHAAFMGSDPANYPYSNMIGKDVAANVTYPWTHNMFQGNAEFPTSNAFNSDSLQGSNINQGLNLSLTADAVTNPMLSQTNLGDREDSKLNIGHGNVQPSSSEQLRGTTFEDLSTDCHIQMNDNRQEYIVPTCLSPNSLAHKNDSEDIVVLEDADEMKPDEPQVPDYMMP